MVDVLAAPQPTKADNSLRTLAAISSAHWVSHFHMFVLPMLFPFLKRELGVSYIDLGFALTIFAVVSGLTQAPVGYLADHVGARKILLMGLTLGGFALIMLGLHLSYSWLIASAVLLGLANSVYHPADYAILSAHMDETRMGRAFSIHTFAGCAGHRRGTRCRHRRPWRTDRNRRGRSCRRAASCLGRCSRCEHCGPRDQWRTGAEAEHHHAGACRADDLFHAAQPVQCRDRQFRRGCADERLRYFVFHRQHRADGLSRRQRRRRAGRRILADRTRRHSQVAAGCFAINAALVLAIAVLALPPPPLIAAMALAGFLGGVIAPSRDMLVRNAAPPGAAGRAFGIVSTGFNIGGIISPLLFGWIMDQNMPHWVFGTSVVFMVLTVLLALVTDRPQESSQPSAQTNPSDSTAGVMLP